MSTSSNPPQLHNDSLAIITELFNRLDNSKRLVFVSGNFNVLHPGHQRLLKYASECGDYLLVGVNADDSEGCFIPEEFRLDGVAATSYVDQAFILRDSPQNFIAHLQPDIVVKGAEHEQRLNPEQIILDSYGGKLLFSSGEVRFASLDLLRHKFTELDLSDIAQPVEFLKRHQIHYEEVLTTLNNIKQLKVVVIGDLIVDEYITCDALGMSQEDPTLVVSPVVSDRFVGGAGIVAAHSRSLGADVNLFSVTGLDDVANFTKSMLDDYGVTANLLVDETRPTTLKQRFRAAEKTLLRVNHLQQTPIRKEIQQKILEIIKPAIEKADLLIFSDFNYGCLPQTLVDQIIVHCKENDVMMVADSQSSSQMGDISRFHDMTILTPTEREARLAMRNFTDGLIVLSESLRKRSNSKHVLLTLGAEGLLVHAEDKSQLSGYVNDKLPALNNSAQDVSGAGDSLLTGAALSLATGSNIWIAAYLGAIAAACQVGRVGNIPLKTNEIRNEICK